MTKKVTDRIGNALESVQQTIREFFSELDELVDQSMNKASLLFESASEMRIDAREWVRRQWPASANGAAQAPTADQIDQLARGIAPVVWLLGKTGAGKSSIVAALTGASHAVVGDRLRPCTRTTSRYDLPVSTPIVSFLDTRGLEEPDYDPLIDIDLCLKEADLIIAVVRASDPAQTGVLHALQLARKAKPQAPIIIAQTDLHRSYQLGADHPPSYAFDRNSHPFAEANVPRQLVAQLANQRSIFAGLKGAKPLFVPIDFTQAEDGFTQTDYGKQELVTAILSAAPGSVQRVMRVRLQQEKTGATEEQVRAAYVALLADAFASVQRERQT